MIYENLILDEERALYDVEDSTVKNCTFDGPADGESALKECRNIVVDNCDFMLRYPFWHVCGAEIVNSRMQETCRAALWYDKDVSVINSALHGIKALRECENVSLSGCSIISSEFGWRCRNVDIKNCVMESEYQFFECKNINIDNLSMKGKYSFQYIENAIFENCTLDTKDAFWHAKNVVVKNCVVKGEYLAWYSENITFENCIIYGTQPLCYCKGLKLINCEMHDADLAFELSEVEASLITPIISIKNPLLGEIILPSVGEIINDNNACKCKIILTE
jgi:hypothetical protein